MLTIGHQRMVAREPTSHVLITSVTAQDGAYLSEPLLSKGYEVHLNASENLPQVTSFWASGTLRQFSR